MDVFALEARIKALLSEKDYLRIAIDGPCASGKSTLGARLCEDLDGTLMHMDDYYIPFARKTPERMAEPGGNVDYERFFEEFTSRAAGEEIPFRRFDCATQTLLPVETICPKRLTVVEGSYSLHPKLREIYDLKIWIEAPLDERLRRIAKRNGEAKVKEFVDRWIPLEDDYFSAFGIKALCDICISGE